jgi:hypothetical protein
MVPAAVGPMTVDCFIFWPFPAAIFLDNATTAGMIKSWVMEIAAG